MNFGACNGMRVRRSELGRLPSHNQHFSILIVKSSCAVVPWPCRPSSDRTLRRPLEALTSRQPIVIRSEDHKNSCISAKVSLTCIITPSTNLRSTSEENFRRLRFRDERNREDTYPRRNDNRHEPTHHGRQTVQQNNWHEQHKRSQPSHQSPTQGL